MYTKQENRIYKKLQQLNEKALTTNKLLEMIYNIMENEKNNMENEKKALQKIEEEDRKGVEAWDRATRLR